MSRLNQVGINLRFRLDVWLNYEKPCVQNEAGQWILGRFKNGRLEGQLLVDDKLNFDSKNKQFSKYYLATEHEVKEVPFSAISKQLRHELLGINALGKKPVSELLAGVPLPFKWDMRETFAIMSKDADDRIHACMGQFISQCANKDVVLDAPDLTLSMPRKSVKKVL